MITNLTAALKVSLNTDIIGRIDQRKNFFKLSEDGGQKFGRGNQQLGFENINRTEENQLLELLLNAGKYDAKI